MGLFFFDKYYIDLFIYLFVTDVIIICNFTVVKFYKVQAKN